MKTFLILTLILACTYVADLSLRADTKGLEVKGPTWSFATK